jgi:hypothetical protein
LALCPDHGEKCKLLDATRIVQFVNNLDMGTEERLAIG